MFILLLETLTLFYQGLQGWYVCAEVFVLEVLFFLLVALHFLMQFGFLWGSKSMFGNSPKDERSDELTHTKSIRSDKYYCSEIVRIIVTK